MYKICLFFKGWNLLRCILIPLFLQLRGSFISINGELSIYNMAAKKEMTTYQVLLPLDLLAVR